METTKISKKEIVIRQCKCKNCIEQTGTDEQRSHHQINVLMSRLDEQQRRWYAGVEAQRYGHGGIALLHRITGLDVKTIKRGIEEIRTDLDERPVGRVRLPGAGRPTIEKKRR